MGQFGADGIDLGIEQTHMDLNNQAHLFIDPSYDDFSGCDFRHTLKVAITAEGYLVITYQPYYLCSAFASPKPS